jgi:hypothetical protein
MCNPALALMGASAIVGVGSARAGARSQQQSLLADASASDRNAVTADNAALVAENNADLAEWQARDSVRTGEIAVGDVMRDRSTALSQVRNEAATVTSKQRTAAAANGVDVGIGSAADLQASTAYVGELNANRVYDAADRNVENIRNNAINNAWGYRVQSTGYRDQAAVNRADAELYRYDARRQRAGSAAISPGLAGTVSLLGSASQVASSWYGSSKGK